MARSMKPNPSRSSRGPTTSRRCRKNVPDSTYRDFAKGTGSWIAGPRIRVSLMSVSGTQPTGRVDGDAGLGSRGGRVGPGEGRKSVGWPAPTRRTGTPSGRPPRAPPPPPRGAAPTHGHKPPIQGWSALQGVEGGPEHHPENDSGGHVPESPESCLLGR